MVLQLLAAVICAVAITKGDRPDAAGHAAEHRVLGIDAVAEEKGEVRREVIDLHAASEVGLDVGEAVGQRECELRDGVRSGLGNVVARDRD